MIADFELLINNTVWYVDGQAVGKRLSKQVKKATETVKKGVDLYNDTITEATRLTFEQASDLTSQMYSHIFNGSEVIL